MPQEFDTIAKTAVDSVGTDISKAIGLPTKLDQLTGETLNLFAQKILQQILSFGTKILIAILIYFVGRWIIKKLKRICTRIFERREIEPSLRTFLISLINITLTIVLLVIIVSVLGIETSSFVALFASAGVAIGLALSGTLQNFAGGVMVLLFKPYKVGDVIEAQGYTGTVKEIQIFNTILNTLDNKAIIIPNGGLATGIINNYSKENIRRIEWIYGIAYGDDFDKARTLILNLINEDNRILNSPAEPFVALNKLGDNSVDIVVRVWVQSSEYWNVYFNLNERVYKSFEQAGLNIPFPQMDIHIKRD
ncbi:MAG: mechanosensitive ion channel [Bacteroidota bacterium]|uniref:mechanosensitive ion channel family protein n=1 Tax=Parabacteroides sp. FAFU027 TaxID=2922715 RepID=UPI001FAF4F6C|nr:mechanosensitive ion channel domain-containing protein [Parabacteroides sp. FAFU027]MDP4269162.1 mechanosensitive ion channel [Bacteroidota bacterium]